MIRDGESVEEFLDRIHTEDNATAVVVFVAAMFILALVGAL